MSLDYLIQNAVVLDGSGAPGFSADVAISGGKIEGVGHFPNARAAHTLDARGRVLTPGFLDIHRHADAAGFRPGFGELELRQGLTSIVSGNCGLSLAPVSGPHRQAILDYLAPVTGPVGPEVPTGSLADYRAALRTPLHLGMLVGAGTLRAVAAGYDVRQLEDSHYRAIHAMLETALADGALGVSLGLGYAPECFYSTPELIHALAPLTGSGVPITVHMRSEGDGMVDSLREMLEVAQALHTPVHISHLKAIGQRNWRRLIPQALVLLDQARQTGLDVSCDVYPYTAGSTQLTHILPPEFLQGGTDAICARLADPLQREQLARRLDTGTDFENIVLLAGWENICMSTMTRPENKPYEGLSVEEAAQRRGQAPLDCACDLLVSERCGITMIDFIAQEEDVEEILRSDCSCVISDSTYPTQGLPHPRLYGTFIRVLERYVRQRRTLSLSQAVARMTRIPAGVLRLRSKGRIAPGYDADLNLFDPALVHEAGSYADPAQFPTGMDWGFVAGRPVISEGVYLGGSGGKVL